MNCPSERFKDIEQVGLFLQIGALAPTDARSPSGDTIIDNNLMCATAKGELLAILSFFITSSQI